MFICFPALVPNVTDRWHSSFKSYFSLNNSWECAENTLELLTIPSSDMERAKCELTSDICNFFNGMASYLKTDYFIFYTSVMECCRYTAPFKWHHRKKSHGLRSGKYCGRFMLLPVAHGYSSAIMRLLRYLSGK
ncbi:hypothetical protein AVEN_143243-1 [Araneus ventricosus]|uniref:Uncharacterized protein n=1 Tax=Araneus ventricosus TaxID=182803 RepID=A0A4Y2AF13_ARAVE|nr:hypothetical protein AVEN_143243-1 [Araneus ventricosus]